MPAEAPFSASLSAEDLAAYVARQMEAFFPDGAVDAAMARKPVAQALERVAHCFRRNRMKCYWEAGAPRFNHRHTDQYAVFLYYLSNCAYRAGLEPLAEKAYALNKALHGLDAFYEVQLPDVFALQHPVGTVLGRAVYGDYFCAYQNVGVGANLDGDSPVFGAGVVLYGGARVLGRAKVGGNCFVSAGALVLNQDVPAGHLVYGVSPGLAVKPTKRNVIRDIFKDSNDKD